MRLTPTDDEKWPLLAKARARLRTAQATYNAVDIQNAIVNLEKEALRLGRVISTADRIAQDPPTPIAVVYWVGRDAAPYDAEEVGAFGGGWVFGQTWYEYLACMGEELWPYLCGIRAATLRGECGGGLWHVSSSTQGVPVFADGAVGIFSAMAWGDLIAATRAASWRAFAPRVEIVLQPC